MTAALALALVSGAPASAQERGDGGRSQSPPAGSAYFTDVTDDAGIDAAHAALRADNDTSDPDAVDLEYLITGQAWGDYDNDDDLDLYVTSQSGPNVLYENRNGTFERSPLADDVALADDPSGAAVFADYDNDGLSDLLVTSRANDTLFRNVDGESFDDVTARAGIENAARAMTASWGDYDADGHLDLFIANYGCQPCEPTPETGDRDVLYHNNGDGTFTDATDALSAGPLDGYGFIAGWFDYDGDADLDLYLVNDARTQRYTQPNALFRNDGPGCDGWCFTDVSDATGAGVRVDGMGLAIGDYDGDGDQDLFMSNSGYAAGPITGPTVLLRNDGGRFTDVSDSASAAVDGVTWGVAFTDFDLDTRLDIYAVLGIGVDGEGPQATYNRLLRNRGDATFEDRTAQSGAADPAHSFGLSVGDYNADGLEDLLVGDMDNGYRLYANNGTAAGDRHRISIALKGGDGVNTDAIGTRVSIRTTDGAELVRQVGAAAGLGGGSDLAVHAGLGEAAIDEVAITWPDGTRESFADVPVDVRWEVTRGGEPSATPLADVGVDTAPVQALQTQGLRVGGLFIPLLFVMTAALFGLWFWLRRRGEAAFAKATVTVLVLLAVGFQIAHFAEHIVQFGYWLLHPSRPPYISSWGIVATDGFTSLAGGSGGRASGTELLHLAGNSIFYLGVVALYIAMRSLRLAPRRMRWCRVAFWVQGFHVAEHILLTTTWFVFGRAIGVSTLFGAAYFLPGAWAPSIRVWWHFVLNLVATIAMIGAVVEGVRAGIISWPGRGAGPAPEPTIDVPDAHDPVAEREPVGAR